MLKQLDTSKWSHADLLREAKLQTDAIQKLNVWLRLGYSLLAVGFLLGYWGFYGDGGTGVGIGGLIILVVGALVSIILKVGTTNAKKNVNALLKAAGVDLSKTKKKTSTTERKASRE